MCYLVLFSDLLLLLLLCSPSLAPMFTGSQFSLKKLVTKLLKKWNTLGVGQEEAIWYVEGTREGGGDSHIYE